MFALRGRGFGRAVRGGDAGGQGGFVLPRPFRRVARFFAEGKIDEWSVPRHAGSIGAVAFLSAVGLYGMVLGGHTQHVLNVGTSAAGFSVDDVVIEGNDETSGIDVLQALGLAGDASVMAMSVADARTALLQLPWVEQAEVRKVYPNDINVKLTERDAFAIWQNGSDLFLIEPDGNVITRMSERKYIGLPLFVGLGADTQAAEMVALMNGYPELAARVRAFVRVADRRWDLYLNNGVIVRLPEEETAEAVAELNRLDAERQLLSRDIASVDMRLTDRLTIRLTPDALEARKEMVEKRAEELERMEKNV